MRISTRSLMRTALCLSIATALLAPAARGQATPPSAPATQPSTMRFKPYVIKDDQGFKMDVLHGVMPADWTVKGTVTWKMGLRMPDLIRIHWADAQDVCAFDVYPTVPFRWNNPNSPYARRIQPGQIVAGNIYQEPPTDQFDAFDKVIIKYFRPDLKNAKIVSKQDMPNAAKAISDKANTDPSWPITVSVGRETFEYDLNGQTMQEVVSGAYVIGGSQQLGFENWVVSQATSARAPKATFDQLKPINAIMIQSLQVNPAWTQKVAALIQQRYQQALANQRQQAANQQAQFNAIESRISSQSAANDAEHDEYWQHSADLARQSDAEADVQREVSPWQGADGQTYKLPTTYGNAWQSTDGTILMNNENGYNPNTDPSAGNTTWTQLQQAPGQ